MAKFTVRRATPDEAVMNIGIMYDGTDYLPYFYNDFLRDPDYMCYVCEVDGEVVGYECVLLHDGGKAAQSRAGRIKPSHRGRGYVRLMEQRIIGDIENFTSAEHIIYVNGRETVKWDTVIPPITHLDNLEIYAFGVSKTRSFQHPPHVLQLTEKDFLDILDSPSACRILFPKDLIYVQYVPLGMHKSNLRHIFNKNTKVFVTLAKSDKTDASSKDVLHTFKPDCIRLLTIGLYYPFQTGEFERCGVTIFGNHPEDLDSHVQALFCQVPATKNIDVGFHPSDGFPSHLFTPLFFKYGSGDIKDYRRSSLCVFRNEIQRKLKAKY